MLPPFALVGARNAVPCCAIAPSGDATIHSLASCLKLHSAALARCLPGLLAAAAIKLQAAAAQLLQGCFSACDGQAELVQTVLEGLHEALQQSDCDDGLLRGCVAVRLALMLQQQQELDAAIAVVQQVRVCNVACHHYTSRHHVLLVCVQCDSCAYPFRVRHCGQA